MRDGLICCSCFWRAMDILFGVIVVWMLVLIGVKTLQRQSENQVINVMALKKLVAFDAKNKDTKDLVACNDYNLNLFSDMSETKNSFFILSI